MSIDIHALAIATFVPMLRNLSSVLDKGAQHAKSRGYDVAVLVKAFHVVTAYDILRHNGVDIGNRDYTGHAAVYLRPQR